MYLPSTTKHLDSPGESAKFEPHGELILIVDDDARVLNSSALLMEAAGFRTERARDGKEAVRLFKDHTENFSAVVIDVTMPDMSGPEVLEQLRQSSPTMPVILCSGWESRTLNISLDEYTDFLPKPYRLDALLGTLGPLLGKKR